MLMYYTDPDDRPRLRQCKEMRGLLDVRSKTDQSWALNSDLSLILPSSLVNDSKLVERTKVKVYQEHAQLDIEIRPSHLSV